MAVNGQVLDNPALKDRITFLKTASETGGEYSLFRVELAPGGGVVSHYHTTFTERFEGVDGELHLDLNGHHLTLGPGQVTHAPLRAAHRFYNPTTKVVTFMTEIRPARHFEKNLKISYGLARDGKTNAQGLPKNLLHLAVMFQFAETYWPGIPAFIQKVSFGALGWLARLLGVEAALAKRYLG
jgi:mannose-6-phosphate isomerase-like protein (cupin superfamily)